MLPIQSASFSALPQQALRELRSSPASANAGPNAQPATEKLAESTETGDRDAQEQYQGQSHAQDRPSGQAADPLIATAQSADAIWDLSVADDQPPPDLDIRG